ncbi:MAG TPA: ribosome maturation factor RimP [Firmicutes bacterium]|nr:ribosome maturation factor RimP [Bacillota bacterium]
MSQLTEKMTRLAEPFAVQLGLELVDVEFVREGGRHVLRFLIDKEGGVTLDDCEAMSRLLDSELDRLDPIPHSYMLQVSSPGIERPLKKADDYLRFQGRPAVVKLFAPLDGQKVFRGVLKGLEADHILLETDDRGIVRLPLEQVAKSNLAFEDRWKGGKVK